MSHLTLVIFKKSINALELVSSGVESEASLKKKYQQEFNSWRSRRAWAKKHKLPFHPEWNVFSVFLEYVGLAPTKDHTIDRIKNDLGYVPNNIRWATKQQQSKNRDNVIWLEYDGKKRTLTDWAKATYQDKSVLFRRFKANWPTENIITGVKPNTVVPRMYVPNSAPWPESHRDFFEYQYRLKNRYSGTPFDRLRFLVQYIRRTLKEISNDISSLIESYPPNNPDIEYELEAHIEQRLEKLEAKKTLYLSFQKHANLVVANHNRIVNGDIL